MSVVVFHPSVAPFVQQAARALHEAGWLERFDTTVSDDPSRWSQRVLCRAARLAGRDLATQFRRRAVTEIPAAKVVSHPWGELLRLAVGQLDRGGRATDVVWEKTEHGFDRRVSRSLQARLTGVYGFEHSSLFTFQRARALGLRVAYDVPAPESSFVHEILARETERFPQLRTQYLRHTRSREARRLARRRAEWQAADVIIAASEFTKQSYARAGLSCADVQVVPYGSPPVATRDKALTPRPGPRPLTVVWAGTFSIRKGAHYLLEAWRQGGFGAHARLHVFGAIGLPDAALHPLPAGVELRGSVPRGALFEEYLHADALVFPTLCDGFGMVVTEAWSRGLPVITTDRAGAADLLRPRQNGLLIRAGDPGAIAEALHWCLEHPRELAAMREEALTTAAGWQWSDYRRTLVAKLAECGFFQRRR